MEYLTILYSYQCNYKCPFCVLGNTLDRAKNCKLWSKETKEKCFKYILDNDVKVVTIMGGEPLLYPNECLDIINFCKKNDAKVTVYTNASLLTKELVDFFNDNDVHIAFSINYYGYKSLDHLVKKAKDKNIINLINELKYKSIRTVYNRNYSLFTEATILHTLFNCNIEFSCDFRKSGIIDKSEIDWLEYELNKLYKYYNDLSWFGLAPSGNSHGKNITIYPDGIITGITEDDSNSIYYGSSRIYDKMSIEDHNRYMCISSNLNYIKNNKHLCRDTSCQC